MDEDINTIKKLHRAALGLFDGKTRCYDGEGRLISVGGKPVEAESTGKPVKCSPIDGRCKFHDCDMETDQETGESYCPKAKGMGDSVTFADVGM